MEVRVRFAPSPTGLVSLANIRTALFTWLFARHEGGVFLVRIEDTDRERSRPEYEADLLKSLEWFGLESDEPVVRQSERLGTYEAVLRKLLEERKAYRCFCTPEELEAERQAQLSQGLPPKYGGRCRGLSPAEVEEKQKTRSSVIRFRMPEGIFAFTDLVRGKVEFSGALFGDIIIAKGLREPLYNFAVVVDDFDARVSHVIRGEEHLSNTPKQMAIQDALGYSHPHYAHLPLILGPDRKKLSKRFMAASVSDYRTQGYLPEALLNFLVLLGWHPVPDREVLDRAAMVKEFDIRRVQKGGAVFNEEKLEWLNAHYLRTLSVEALVGHLKPFIPEGWMKDEVFFRAVVGAERERLKRLSGFADIARFFFELPDYPSKLLHWNDTPPEDTVAALLEVRSALEKLNDESFTSEGTMQALASLVERRGRGEVFWPLRVALSGSQASPAPQDLLAVLKKKESLRRIDIALRKFSEE